MTTCVYDDEGKNKKQKMYSKVDCVARQMDGLDRWVDGGKNECMVWIDECIKEWIERSRNGWLEQHIMDMWLEGWR